MKGRERPTPARKSSNKSYRRLFSIVFGLIAALSVFYAFNNASPRSKTLVEHHATALEEADAPSLQPPMLKPITQIVPKVALLFLSRGGMPHEDIWQTWLQAAEGLLPVEFAEEVSAKLPPVPQAKPAYLNKIQLLYSIYIHAPPSYEYPENSLWAPHRIPERVATAWATHSLIKATRLLLKNALTDPENEWFLLVSETDIPLYDPLTTWRQLMSQNRSHINACAGDPGVTMVRRWTARMETPRLKMEHWRKSNQFFAMIRKHAQVVVEDQDVYCSFEKECYWGFDKDVNRIRDCISDEHYIATLMAVEGLASEMNCDSWGISMMHWGSGGEWAHPRSFRPHDVEPGLIWQLRGENETRVTAARRSAYASFTRLMEGQNNGENLPNKAEYSPLADVAKLTARKFPDYSADAIKDLLISCNSSLYILNSEEQCAVM